MDTSEITDFLLKHPGLVQSPVNRSTITGNVRIQDKYLRLHMSCPNYPSIRELKIAAFSGLSVRTHDETEFDSRWSVNQVLEEILKSTKTSNRTSYSQASEQSSFQAKNDLLQLKSSQYKIRTNAQCSWIQFSDFERFKGHFLELKASANNQFALSDHSLPDSIQWEELFRSSNSIKTLLTDFQKYLDELRDFYTNLTDIDELCYVVQPLKPTTKHNWRVFKLKEKVFVKLVLDPFTCSPVAVNLIGPTHETVSLRHVLSEGLKNWDTDMDVHANLLRIFELTYFPMVNEGAEQFCNICYCYELEGHIPLISCDNQSCNLVYHGVCLKEWFSTLSDGKVFLDVSFGACPFCKEKLSTSFADVLR